MLKIYLQRLSLFLLILASSTHLLQAQCAAPSPVASGTTIVCGATAALTASGGTNYTWYSDAAGTTQIGTGANYTTPVLNTNTTYYVQNSTGSNVNVFYINSLATAGATYYEHAQYTGDDRGGIAVTQQYYYINGDQNVARYDMPNLTNPVSYTRRDGIFSDMAGSGTLYTLWNSNNNSDPVGTCTSFNINAVRTLNSDCSLGATIIPLSQSFTMGSCQDAAVFNGMGYVILFTGNGGSPANTYFRVDLPTGAVTNMGAYGLSATTTENWARWGIAEYNGTNYSVVYVTNSQTISRLNLTTGSIATVQSFNSLSDMANIAYSPWHSRWYYHHEGGSQWGGSDESSGYLNGTHSVVNANACFSPLVPVTVTVNSNITPPTATNVSINCGQTATLTAVGGSGNTYTWYSDAAGTNIIGNGANFTTPVLGQNTTYYVASTTGLAPGVNYSFSNAGATGRYGPNQGQVTNTYAGTNLANQVTINTQGIQEWIVPQTGTYQIQANGAQGGGNGGLGARMQGEFSLTAGQKLFIAVGQQGNGPNDGGACGGGGGSFVATGNATYTTSTPLIVAGGGGGQSPQVGQPGLITTNGGQGENCQPGGTNGNGGADASNCGSGAGGAGGFYTNGASGGGYGSQYGAGFISGAAIGGSSSSGSREGGFGGGAGTHNNNTGGGAGGGYSGGSASYHGSNYEGGGGGSFNSGANTVNTQGIQSGHGGVIITPLSAACASVTVPVIVTINPIVLPTASNATINCGQTATLNAVGNGPFYWYSNAAGTTQVATGATFITPTLSTTTTYYLSNQTGVCGAQNTPVTVTVIPTAPPTANGTTVSCGQTATLTAAGGNGYVWYSDAAGTTQVGNGASFTTPALSSTTTYYVQATAGQANSTLNFTNCNATGNTGPTLAQMTAAYAGTGLAGLVSSSVQGIQQWTVPSTGTYTITAAGAKGGNANNAIGGSGRSITFTTTLTQGDIIKILVGQQGGFLDFSTGWAAGGGGGTFLFNQTTNQLIAAAGGGGGAGQGSPSYPYTINGGDASSYNNTSGGNGLTSPGSWCSYGPGGTNGSGGLGGGAPNSLYGGAGGAGWNGQGSTGVYGGGIGQTFAQGGLGGINLAGCGSWNSSTNGGFGGGGGAGMCTNYEAIGGGGGGYSGGGGGGCRVGAGGGGGCFYTGNYVSETLNTGHGFVNVSFAGAQCFSQLVPVTVTVTPIPAPTASNVSINCGQTATINAIGNGTIYWYDNAAATNGLGTGANFTTPTLSSTTTYYMSGGTGACALANNPVTVTVIPTPPPTANGTTINCGQTATLTAAGGNNYVWYADAAGTTQVGSGATFTSPVLSTNTTYYVQANPNPVNTTLNFTNCNVTGNTGPTLAQMTAAYAGTSLAGLVSSSVQGIQEWTVPSTGTYTITAAGAKGGNANNAIGGSGRSITVTTTLTQGHVIKILVGQQGGNLDFNTGWSGGGGGGTFLFNQTTNQPILIAGGGGGAAQGSPSYPYTLNGVDASAYNVTAGSNGVMSGGSWCQGGSAGSNGSGGGGTGGSGGAGWNGNGTAGYYGNPGQMFANGGLGGINSTSCGNWNSSTNGGFGGGAGAGMCTNYEAAGGGGGGYSGGGGGACRVGAGGGGGCFYTGTFVSETLNNGHGLVNISFAGAQCGSTLVAVPVTVIPTPPPTANGTTINCGQTATLTASNGIIYNWFSDAAGATQVGTGASWTTPTLNATTTYYVGSAASQASGSQSFSYNGSVQTFTAPSTGTYTLEVWGAKGGGGSNCFGSGGNGGYSKGDVTLNAGQTIYLALGQQGFQSSSMNAYNGGGAGNPNGNDPGYTGGGATHIATSNGTLASLSGNQNAVLLVAGGGGGAAGGTCVCQYQGNGGVGGGLSGVSGTCSGNDCNYRPAGSGGTQNGGGNSQSPSIASGFGLGATSSTSGGDCIQGGGGGGGWYGGGAGGHAGGGGGGGSGYVAPSLLLTQVTDGASSMPNPAGGLMTGNAGNGVAKISWSGAGCLSQLVPVLVTVTPPASPTASPVAISCGQTATVSAVGGGGNTYNWYSDAAATNLVGTGASWTTPTLYSTSTYYVTSGSGAANGNVFTFTNCSATGQYGPTQGQVNSAYAGTNLAGNVTSNNGIQTWTVPASGTYQIEAFGAQGGGNNQFGRGAQIRGDFNLTAGQQLQILVGQSGGYYQSGSGGGGTFVVTSANTPLLIAGGGGGQYDQNSSLYNAHAVTANNGQASGCTSGGVAGAGGSGCGNNGASGGGGFITNGGSGSYGTGGLSFLNGGNGGNQSSQPACIGGFGGGGGTHGNTGGGGGGGGYSGGAGGYHSGNDGSGGGGGSYNTGTNPVNAGGVNTGHGYVVITSLITPCASVPVPVTVTVSPIPAPTASNVTINCGQTATINAVGNGTIYWYSDAAGTNGLGTGATYTTSQLSSTTTYYMSGGSGQCALVNNPVTVTVLAPAAPTAAPTTIGCGQTATLTAAGGGGNSYTWYSDAAGTVVVGNGANFTTPALALNTTYYVASGNVNNAQPVSFSYTGSTQTYTVPAGVTSITVDANGAGGGAQPGNGGQAGAGGKMLATIPVTPGQVLSIIVGGAGGNSQYNRSGSGGGGFTGVLDASNNHLVSAGGGGGAAGNEGCPQVGNGGNGGASSGTQGSCGLGGAAGVNAVSPAGGIGGTGSIPGAAGNASGGGLGGATQGDFGTGGGGGGYGITAAASQYGSCGGNSGAGGFGGGGSGGTGGCGGSQERLSGGGGGGGGYTGGGGGTTTPGCASCGGGGGGGGSNFAIAAASNITSIVGGGALAQTSGSLTITPVSANCLSVLVPVTVTVTPIPSPTAANATINCGQTATLTAVGNGNVYWFSDAAGTIQLGTGASFTTPQLGNTTTYYVSSSTGICAVVNNPVTVTVNAPASPIAANATINCGQTVTLSAAGGGGNNYTWYSDAAATVQVGTGATLTTPALVGTSTYYVTSNSGAGNGNVYTFTNCSATGQYGPSQGQVNNAYAATNLAGNVTSSNGIQLWTVPSTGTYRIEAFGAQGGGNNNFGRGAQMRGDFNLTAGQQLQILVGQSGGYYQSGSGGGGSFVVTSANLPLVIAGGGGGQYDSNSSLYNAHAVTANNGQSSGCTSGGVAGAGGNGCGNSGASGGGGFNSNGGNGVYGTGGQSFSNGGNGGNNSSQAACIGGFGGGGGTHGNTGGGGGGGGYSGGAGGYHSGNDGSGGGAGSYNSGTNPLNVGGINTGHGLVTITSLTTPCASAIVPVVVTVNPIAAPVVAGNIAFCGQNSITTTLTASGSVNDYAWWTNANATGALGTGAVYTTPVLNNTTTYYVQSTTPQGGSQTFNYTGSAQTFTAPVSGTYSLEAWGAQGGNDVYYPNSVFGGRGGYSKGDVYLAAGTTINVYVGGQGSGCNAAYWRSSGGGGATDFRLVGGNWNDNAGLYSRILVAGGGGGRHGNNYEGVTYVGNDGGGLTAPNINACGYNVVGGSQTAGGSSPYGGGVVAGSFGFANANMMSNICSVGGWNGGAAGADNWANGGAGGGWYGGCTSWCTSTGGSGYVYTSSSYVPPGYTPAASYQMTNTQLIAGNTIMPNPLGGTMTGNAGNGVAKITWTGTGCVSAVTPVTVTVGQAPIVSAGNNISICAGAPVTLSGNGAATYAWDNGVANGVAFTPASTQTYTVIGTNANGCSDTAQVTVTVNALPTVSAGNNQTICAGTAVTLNGSGATSYVWNNGVTNATPFTPIATQT
ncbi:MAG: glycine-rich protein, partial [Flavobacteriia bacterium]